MKILILNLVLLISHFIDLETKIPPLKVDSIPHQILTKIEEEITCVCHGD